MWKCLEIFTHLFSHKVSVRVLHYYSFHVILMCRHLEIGNITLILHNLVIQSAPLICTLVISTLRLFARRASSPI